jgi:hypothetical protein
MPYADPLDFVANGLFDGARFSYNLPAGTFSAGAWYTGLLYKKKANIFITDYDRQKFEAELDYGKFSDTYFASRRLVASAGWEHPAIAELLRLRLAVTGQIDLNGKDDFCHSEYFTLKAGLPIQSFLFELGGGAQVMQVRAGGEDDTLIGLAGEIGAYWMLPTLFSSRLSFTGYFSSGRKDDDSTMSAFIPINTKSYGDILEAKFSGISVLSLDYIARLHQTFSANVSAKYFIRSDKGTYKGYPVSVKDDGGYSLGAEFFAQFLWSPVSDLRLELGGGVFVPGMGDAAPKNDPLWRIKAGLVLALY